MRLTLKRYVQPALGAMAIVLVVAACSSSSKGASTTSSSVPSSGTSTAAPTGAKATGTPVTIGIICTCTGAAAQGGVNIVAEDVYKAWADEVNASGGLEGHPVQIKTEDDTSNPGVALTDAESLVSQHVVAIADLSNLDQTFATTVAKADVPVVGVLSSNTPFFTNPDFYSEGGTADVEVKAVIETAKASGATNIAQFYCAEAPICAEAAPAVRAAGKQLGVPDVYSSAIAAAAPNYTAECLAAQQKHATSLFVAESAPIVTRVATDCGRQGYNPTYVIDGEVFEMSLVSSPASSKNLSGEFPDLPFFASTPAVQAFNTAMDKYYPGLREDATRMNQDAFMAWVSGKLLQDAIQAGGLTSAGTPSAAETTAGLQSLKGDTVGGLTPPLRYPAGQAHPIDCWFTGHVSNGVPTAENGGQPTCAT
jgi:branched-chain amino acid transport system substrate-binding protein